MSSAPAEGRGSKEPVPWSVNCGMAGWAHSGVAARPARRGAGHMERCWEAHSIGSGSDPWASRRRRPPIMKRADADA